MGKELEFIKGNEGALDMLAMLLGKTKLCFEQIVKIVYKTFGGK